MLISLTAMVLIIPCLGWGKSMPERSVAAIKIDPRIEHAKELLGPGYQKSFMAGLEKHQNLESKVHQLVEKQLPKKHRPHSSVVAATIIAEAAKYGLDPYFIMALISGESSFNPEAIGSVGEIGLMQLRPTTASWIAKKNGLNWEGSSSLLDPVINIKLGVAYVAWLRERFDNHGRLYLAAYNMGPKSVKSALGRKVWPKDYPKHVMKRYFALYKEL
jgi:soluble lytic murein transglycosylase